jgi:hypothetical protein
MDQADLVVFIYVNQAVVHIWEDRVAFHWKGREGIIL